MTKAKAVSERELVLETLLEITEQGAYSHLALRAVLEKYQYLEKRERAFITRVTEGTLEHMLELDYILDQFSKVKVRKMKPVIRGILRSAVYQLKYMDSVPDSAVCNEAVKLAVKKGFGSLRGFVNGVLRNVARNLDHITWPSDPMEALSVRYSMPRWILQVWLDSYGQEKTEQMLQAFQQDTPVTVRCNRDQVTMEELEEHLTEAGVQWKVHPYLPYALRISGYDYLGDLACFQKGECSVQDISSMLVCEAAAPKEGDHVIDVCAAPGGKALHMAELLRGTGHVEARDLTPAKVMLIEENIARTGLKNISACCKDAEASDETSVGTADIVIADLPCSGLGVLGKKTDLKYKTMPEDVEALAALQRRILSNVEGFVKPGGRLIYSTCTIHPAENQENVRWFLEQYPDYELEDIADRLPEQLRDSVEEKGCLQLLPGIHESDGFFLAVFRKKQ